MDPFLNPYAPGAGAPAYSGQIDQRFRFNSIKHSGSNRSVILVQTDQGFWLNSISNSGANRSRIQASFDDSPKRVGRYFNEVSQGRQWGCGHVTEKDSFVVIIDRKVF